jgi:hypothetical protein
MKRLLATLGLPPLPTVEALGEESCHEELPRLLSLERFQVRLSDAPEEERVLWLRFASCGDEGVDDPSPDVVRGVVLRPLGPGRWCRIEAPFLNADTNTEYGPSPYLCEPPEFSFVHLTSERHRVFRLVQANAVCVGTAAGHVITRWLSFWELRGTGMQRLFKTEIFQSPLPYSSNKVLEARVRIVGDSFPRQLVVTERVSEMFSEEQGAARHMRYWLDEVAGRYVRSKRGQNTEAGNR